jgi:hypothetical protein
MGSAILGTVLVVGLRCAAAGAPRQQHGAVAA